MTCCGVKIQARRNGDLRVTYSPSSRKFTFSGLVPTLTIRDGDAVLLSVTESATENGSTFVVVGDSFVLTITKEDIALLDAADPDTTSDILSYDVVAMDAVGFENWLLGGPFIVLGINDADCCSDCGDIEVSLDGQCVQVSIEGGNIGAGASVALAELNAAVAEASEYADTATMQAALAAGSALASSNSALAASASADAAAAALRPVVRLSLYLANPLNPDPNQDCAAAFQAAANAASGGELWIDAPFGRTSWTYKFLNPATAETTLPKNVTVRGFPGVTLDYSALGIDRTIITYIDTANGLSATGRAITSAVAGAFTITLSGTGVQDLVNEAAALGVPFEYVHVASQKPFVTLPVGSASPQGEIRCVQSYDIATNTLTLTDPLRDTYNSDTPVVKLWYPGKVNIYGNGLKIKGAGRFTSTAGDYGIRIRDSIGAVQGLILDGCDANAIRHERCIDSVVMGNEARFGPKGSNASVNYAFARSGVVQSTTYIGNTAYGCKHAYVGTGQGAGGVERDLTLIGNYAYGTWDAAFATHDESEDVYYTDNTIVGCVVAYDVRSAGTYIKGGVITIYPVAGFVTQGIECGNKWERCVIDGVTIIGGAYGIRRGDSEWTVGNGPSNISITNNKFIGQTTKSMEISFSGNTNPQTGMVISGNDFTDTPTYGIEVNGTFEAISVDSNKIRLKSGNVSNNAILMTGILSGTVSNNRWSNDYLFDISVAGSTEKIWMESNGDFGSSNLKSRPLGATGAVTINRSYQGISANTGTVDDLENITPRGLGTTVTLFPTAGHTITVLNNAAGTKNIRTATRGSVILTSMTLVCDGTLWWEVGVNDLVGSVGGISIASTPSYTGITPFTVTVTGAAIGDIVTGVSSSGSMAGLSLSGSVTAANTVTVTGFNPTAAAIDPANGQTVTVHVRKA